MIQITWNKHIASTVTGLRRSPLNVELSLVRHDKTWDMPLGKALSVTSPLEKLNK